MPFIYAISDTHGCQDAFERALSVIGHTGENHLYLLGDYIPHQTDEMGEADYYTKAARALSYVRAFQQAHWDHVTVLPGNHELFLLQQAELGKIEITASLHEWLLSLPIFEEAERQVFVHAGVDEEAGEYWRWGSDNWYHCSKFPATFGPFEKDIIAGHVGASGLAGDPDFEGVFWDGQSHYYIDGSTERTGRINILRYDTERRVYEQRVITARSSGMWQAMSQGCVSVTR